MFTIDSRYYDTGWEMKDCYNRNIDISEVNLTYTDNQEQSPGMDISSAIAISDHRRMRWGGQGEAAAPP